VERSIEVREKERGVVVVVVVYALEHLRVRAASE
jgi:hypothetical protein